MFELKCKTCKGVIALDQQRTINTYMATMNYVVNNNGELDLNTIQTYMFYKCLSCNKTYKYTIKDLEIEIRKSFAEIAMLLRKNKVFEANKNKVEEDSVLSYCGKCRGQDGKGNCFSVIMDNCSIRNKR